MPVEASPTTMVVFDVDDTLYLERDYVASGFAALEPIVGDGFGVQGFADVAWRLFEAGRRGDVFNRALGEMGIPADDAVINSLVRAYRQHHPRISLLPDARAALDELHQSGIGTALLTDGPAMSQAAKISALGIKDQVQYAVLTDHYGPGHGKPHPKGFQEIAEKSGADNLVYVADNPLKDFTAPHQLGWLTVRVRRDGGLHASLPHGDEVNETLHDLHELIDVVVSRGSSHSQPAN